MPVFKVTREILYLFIRASISTSEDTVMQSVKLPSQNHVSVSLTGNNQHMTYLVFAICLPKTLGL